MSNQEKMTKYLDFPFDTFLMLRFEYEVIFDDELVVKLLRIIEYYIEAERRRLYREEVNKNGTPDEPLDITRDIWVPLSYKLFMSDLYGKVTSENTLKRALNYLIAHRIIFRKHEPKKRYDAPLYTINHAALQILVTLTRGHQKLIPSIFDALKNSPPQILMPSEYQKLIPSEANLSVNNQSRVSKIDPIFKKSNNITVKESNAVPAQSANADPPASLSFSSEEEMIARLREAGYTVTPPALSDADASHIPDTSTEDHLKSAATSFPNQPSVPDAKQKETGKHADSYSQQRQDNLPEEEQNQGKVLPFASRSEQPTTAQQAKPEKPRRQKPTALAQIPEPKPEKPTIVLGEREQAVYNEWAKMPWFKGIAPKITPTLAGHCATLAKCETIPKVDVMLKTRHWRDQQHPEQKGRGYELGNFVHDYPKYLSSEYQSTLPASERKRNPLGPNLNGITERIAKTAVGANS